MKIISIILGFLLMVIGFSYCIMYINLFSFDYTIGEYFSYIKTRYECWFLIIGFLLTTIALFKKERKHVKRI